MAIKYLRIKNWEKYQDTAGKNCEFVKLSPMILLDIEFMVLPDQTRLVFLLLLAYAGVNSNRIPGDPDLVRHLLQLEEREDHIEPVAQLIEHGLLEPWCKKKHDEMLEKHTFKRVNDRERKRRERDKKRDASVTPPVTTPVTPPVTKSMSRHETETETKTETKKKIKVTASGGAPNSEDNFNTLWVKYPRKLKRKTALARFQKQVKTPEDWENIQKALPNYIKDVELQRSRGHPDLAWQHGSTWFNENWRDYIELEASPEGNGPDGLTDWDQVRAQNNAEKGAQNAEN